MTICNSPSCAPARPARCAGPVAALIVLAAVSSFAVVGEAPAADPGRPPNIVFILADDLGWADLGCAGSRFYETPHIDRMAAQGMTFTAAYAACPVCSPTRAALLTGQYPARLHLTDYIPGARRGKLNPAEYLHHLPLEQVTLAESLRAAGYATAFVGKWHLGPRGYWPEDQGFDVNVGGSERGANKQFSPYDLPNLANGPDGEYLTDRLTDEALKILDARRDRPLLLWLSHYDVHTPLAAKQELIDKFERKGADLPAPSQPRFRPEGAREDRRVQDHGIYAAKVASLDESVGRVLDKLESLGLTDQTLVIFTSDNGGLSTSEGAPTSNAPLRAGKGWLYEGGIRVPMIVRWPGVVRAGSACDEPVISCDVLPTLLSAAGQPPPDGQPCDGRDLSPLLRETGALERAELFWHYPHYGNQGGRPGGAIRAGDWKLIEFFEDDRVELYHLGDDLEERHDLAGERPELAARLLERLRAWRQSVDAAMPTKNPDYREE